MYKKGRRNNRFFPKKKRSGPKPPKPNTEIIRTQDERDEEESSSSSSDSSEAEIAAHPYSSLIESLQEPESESSDSEDEVDVLNAKRQKLEEEDGESSDASSHDSESADKNEENLDNVERSESLQNQEEDDTGVVKNPGNKESDVSESDGSDRENPEENSESDVLVEEDECEEAESQVDNENATVISSDDDDDADEHNEPGSKPKKDLTIPDVYKSHYECDIADSVRVLETQKPQIFQSQEWPAVGKLKYTCRVEKQGTSCLPHPHIPSRPMSNPDSDELERLHRIRRHVVTNWMNLDSGKSEEYVGDVPSDGSSKLFSPLQRELFTLFNSYGDVLYSDKNSVINSMQIQQAYCLHLVNHVLRAKTKMFSHSAKLKQMTPAQRDAVEYRDQGITRPRVLILLPFRETALRVVNFLLKLFQRGQRFEVGNKHRFKEEFGKDGDEADSREEKAFLKKPEDFQRLFAGNVDEHFRVGIALRQNTLRLYAPFYSSDIIIASPLGLRTVIGAEGESHYEHDFLSSIEMLILDHADVFLMQNWEHILHIFEHLNLTPKESHGVDFSRVRNSSLDGLCKYYRQTIAISSVSAPQISSLFTKFCHNHKGAVSCGQLEEKGSICEIAKQLPLVFHKMPPCSLPDMAESRFQFFIDRIYRQYNRANMSQTLVYVAQYFDFVRLRNFMRKEWKSGSGPTFSHINDYSGFREVRRVKRRFLRGKSPLLLYTERHYFYNRMSIRGVRNLIFYELPTYPQFFADMCGMVTETTGAESLASSGSVTVLYSRHDARKLAAVVGLKRCKELVGSSKSVHMFVTGVTAEG